MWEWGAKIPGEKSWLKKNPGGWGPRREDEIRKRGRWGNLFSANRIQEMAARKSAIQGGKSVDKVHGDYAPLGVVGGGGGKRTGEACED